MPTKPKIPANEICWTRYLDAQGNLRFLITSDRTRDMYFLYQREEDGKLKKVARDPSPLALETNNEILRNLHREWQPKNC